MAHVVRLQLSRKRGFSLADHSRETNGLECVNVARPSIWGNPYTVNDCLEAGYSGDATELAAQCVHAFEAWLTSPIWRPDWRCDDSRKRRDVILDRLPSLRGKNVACWCPIRSPCHGDVLLKLASRCMLGAVI